MHLTREMIAAEGVDLDRLERSLGLVGERVGTGRYRVAGGAQIHWVDLYTTSMPRCDCGDHLWRDRICKHILAALLREGDERVIAALAVLMQRVRDRVLAAATSSVPPLRRADKRPAAGPHGLAGRRVDSNGGPARDEVGAAA